MKAFLVIIWLLQSGGIEAPAWREFATVEECQKEVLTTRESPPPGHYPFVVGCLTPDKKAEEKFIVPAPDKKD